MTISRESTVIASSEKADANGDSSRVKEEVVDAQAGVEVPEFPEGGIAAWLAVIGAMLVQFCGFGYTSAFGVYQDFYTQQYLTNTSSSAISWIGSINAFLTTGFGLLTGLLYDRGYFYHLLIGGTLLQSFTLFMLSLAQPGSYYQILLAQGFGVGIAQGFMYVPSMAIVSQYFRRRRTLAMSLVAAGSSLGAVIHPIMLNNLFVRVGFANGVRISAAFVTVLLLCACILIRTRLPPPQSRIDYFAVAKGIARDPPFCLMGVGLFCFQAGFWYPLYYLQLDSIKHGNSENFSFYSLVLLNGASLIGRLSNGFIGPYVGVPRLFIISTTLSAAFILGMIGLSGIATVVVLGLLYGYFAGLYVALLSPLMAILTSDLSELGARLGFGMLLVGLGNLVGTPISGALLTSNYEWWRPSLFSGLIAYLGCLFFVGMQLALIRRQKKAVKQQEA